MEAKANRYVRGEKLKVEGETCPCNVRTYCEILCPDAWQERVIHYALTWKIPTTKLRERTVPCATFVTRTPRLA